MKNYKVLKNEYYEIYFPSKYESDVIDFLCKNL